MMCKIKYCIDYEAIAINFILAKKRRKYRLIYVLAVSRRNYITKKLKDVYLPRNFQLVAK